MLPLEEVISFIWPLLHMCNGVKSLLKFHLNFYEYVFRRDIMYYFHFNVSFMSLLSLKYMIMKIEMLLHKWFHPILLHLVPEFCVHSENKTCACIFMILDGSLTIKARVSVQGVESLWSDCRFIPADWGS